MPYFNFIDPAILSYYKLHTQHKYAIKNLLSAFSQKVLNLNKYLNESRKEAIECKKLLRCYSLLPHGNARKSSNRSTLSRRISSINKTINKLNEKVGDDINLKKQYVLHEYNKNNETFDQVKLKMEKLFVKQQNEYIESECKSIDFCVKIAMTGIMAGWTQKQWNTFNNSVIFIIELILLHSHYFYYHSHIILFYLQFLLLH